MKLKRYIRCKPIFRFAVVNLNNKSQFVRKNLTHEQAYDFCMRRNWACCINGEVVPLCISEQKYTP